MPYVKISYHDSYTSEFRIRDVDPRYSDHNEITQEFIKTYNTIMRDYEVLMKTLKTLKESEQDSLE